MKLSLRLLVPTLAIVLVAGAAALLFSPSIQAQEEDEPTCPEDEVCVMSVMFSSTGPYMVGDTIELTFTFTHKIVAQDTEDPGMSTIEVDMLDPNHPSLTDDDDDNEGEATKPRTFSADSPTKPMNELVFSYTVKGDDPDTVDVDDADPHEGVVSLAENALLSGIFSDIRTYYDPVDDSDNSLPPLPGRVHDAVPGTDHVIDTAAPTLDGVTVESSGLGKTGGTITVKVAFSEDVTVDTATGTPSLILKVGDKDRTATYSDSESSGKNVVFIYKTVKGDDGEVSLPTDGAISLNEGAISDLAGNPTTESLAFPEKVTVGEHTVVTDDAAPSVTYKPPSSLTVGIRIRAIMPKTDDDDISSYEITAGRLPRTLRFDAKTGYITGRPTRAVAGPTRLTIKVCDDELAPNCDENVTLTLPAILEDEDEEDVAAAVATLPAVPPVDLSDVSVGDAVPSSALQLALAATGGALLLGGIGVMTARRRARVRR